MKTFPIDQNIPHRLVDFYQKVPVGALVGACDGELLGDDVGLAVGVAVGAEVGDAEGEAVGVAVGELVGADVAFTAVGANEGATHQKTSDLFGMVIRVMLLLFPKSS